MTKRSAPALDLAMDFLRLELAHGPKPTRQVCAGAMEYGIAIPTLERARKQIGIISRRVGKPGKRGGGEVLLELPAPVQPKPAFLTNCTALEGAMAFLEQALERGPCPSREVYAKAQELGIASVTLERARKQLGIVWYRIGIRGIRGGGEVIIALPRREGTEKAG